jgi:hypothetical protein
MNPTPTNTTIAHGKEAAPHLSNNTPPTTPLAVQAQATLSGLTDQNSGEGDAFMFKNTYSEQSRDQVARVFGSKFAISLFKQTPGSWVGPVESGFGWHLVAIIYFRLLADAHSYQRIA